MRVANLLSATAFRATVCASSSSSSSASASALFNRSFHTTLYYRQDDIDGREAQANAGPEVQTGSDIGQALEDQPYLEVSSADGIVDSKTEKKSTETTSPKPPTSASPLFRPSESRPTLASLFGLSDDGDDFAVGPHPDSLSAVESPERTKRTPFSLFSRDAPSSSSDASPSDFSAYDGLFDTPDAFNRTESFAKRIPSGRRGTQRDALFNRTQDGGSHPGSHSARRNHPVKLDPHEKRKWQKLLADVASNLHADVKGSGASTSSPLDGPFGAFARRNDLEQVRQKRRTLRRGGEASVSDGTGRIARLTEGIGSDLSEDDIEAGVDQARQDMNLQTNEADLWAWAAKEIWAFDETKHNHDARKSRPASDRDSELTEVEVALKEEEVVHKAAYGMGTPFYGPVLHQLLIHFRDRLKSPTSALAVLQITRALGPRSLVLGCTAELYTEAISTLWEEGRDARGILALLKEAKGSGIVDARITRGIDEANWIGKPRVGSLIGVAQRVQEDIRQSVLAGRAQSTSFNGSAKTLSKSESTETTGFSEDDEKAQRLSSLFPNSETVEPPPSMMSNSVSTTDRSGVIGEETLTFAAIQALIVADEIGQTIGGEGKLREASEMRY